MTLQMVADNMGPYETSGCPSYRAGARALKQNNTKEAKCRDTKVQTPSSIRGFLQKTLMHWNDTKTELATCDEISGHGTTLILQKDNSSYTHEPDLTEGKSDESKLISDNSEGLTDANWNELEDLPRNAIGANSEGLVGTIPSDYEERMKKDLEKVDLIIQRLDQETEGKKLISEDSTNKAIGSSEQDDSLEEQEELNLCNKQLLARGREEVKKQIEKELIEEMKQVQRRKLEDLQIMLEESEKRKEEILRTEREEAAKRKLEIIDQERAETDDEINAWRHRTIKREWQLIRRKLDSQKAAEIEKLQEQKEALIKEMSKNSENRIQEQIRVETHEAEQRRAQQMQKENEEAEKRKAERMEQEEIDAKKRLQQRLKEEEERIQVLRESLLDKETQETEKRLRAQMEKEQEEANRRKTVRLSEEEQEYHQRQKQLREMESKEAKRRLHNELQKEHERIMRYRDLLIKKENDQAQLRLEAQLQKEKEEAMKREEKKLQEENAQAEDRLQKRMETENEEAARRLQEQLRTEMEESAKRVAERKIVEDRDLDEWKLQTMKKFRVDIDTLNKTRQNLLETRNKDLKQLEQLNREVYDAKIQLKKTLKKQSLASGKRLQERLEKEKEEAKSRVEKALKKENEEAKIRLATQLQYEQRAAEQRLQDQLKLESKQAKERSLALQREELMRFMKHQAEQKTEDRKTAELHLKMQKELENQATRMANMVLTFQSQARKYCEQSHPSQKVPQDRATQLDRDQEIAIQERTFLKPSQIDDGSSLLQRVGLEQQGVSRSATRDENDKEDNEEQALDTEVDGTAKTLQEAMLNDDLPEESKGVRALEEISDGLPQVKADREKEFVIPEGKQIHDADMDLDETGIPGADLNTEEGDHSIDYDTESSSLKSTLSDDNT
ncbi:hypothetical protein QAD02_014355 [Eretmocerus hayati]|uniref:Uncharacterized protein n=1 Tax=Eretmocerus hayati TaxID=131215 RepID=A0ACC2P643_9HYME|nr:hypothetical protein QAD02_014355 [Eretmocerus hayati]